MAIFLESVLQRSMSGVWKRGHGRDSKAPPDERGGNSSTYSKGATSRLHRRAGAAAGSLHPAGARTAASDPAAQASVATTATAADRHSHRPPPTPVVQTFPPNPLIDNGRGIEKPTKPRRRVRPASVKNSLGRRCPVSSRINPRSSKPAAVGESFG